VKYCDLLDWIRAKWLQINKIVPVSEKLRRCPWGFVSKGSRRPQRSISTMVNGNCSTSHLRNVRRTGLDGRYHNGDRHRNTDNNGWSRLKTEVYKVVSAHHYHHHHCHVVRVDHCVKLLQGHCTITKEPCWARRCEGGPVISSWFSAFICIHH